MQTLGRQAHYAQVLSSTLFFCSSWSTGQESVELGFSLKRKVDVNLLLMTNSKRCGAQNQLVTTQYSVIHYYTIDHVTHLMKNQQSDMWYLHNEHVPEI